MEVGDPEVVLVVDPALLTDHRELTVGAQAHVHRHFRRPGFAVEHLQPPLLARAVGLEQPEIATPRNARFGCNARHGAGSDEATIGRRLQRRERDGLIGAAVVEGALNLSVGIQPKHARPALALARHPDRAVRGFAHAHHTGHMARARRLVVYPRPQHVTERVGAQDGKAPAARVEPLRLYRQADMHPARQVLAPVGGRGGMRDDEFGTLHVVALDVAGAAEVRTGGRRVDQCVRRGAVAAAARAARQEGREQQQGDEAQADGAHRAERRNGHARDSGRR